MASKPIGSIAEEIRALTATIIGDVSDDGGEGGGTSGSSGVMRVAMIYDESLEEEGYTLDKSYDEIRQAIEDEKLVFLQDESGHTYFYNDEHYSDTAGSWLVFNQIPVVGDNQCVTWHAVILEGSSYATITEDRFERVPMRLTISVNYDDSLNEWDVYCGESVEDIIEHALNNEVRAFFTTIEEPYRSSFYELPAQVVYTDGSDVIRFSGQTVNEDGTALYVVTATLNSDGTNTGIIKSIPIA